VELSSEFQVPAPPQEAWDFLLDVERVAPCVPGAQLDEIVDERTWKGHLKVKLGPISLAFSGTVVLEDIDAEKRTVRMRAEGREAKGKGGATASVTSTLAAGDDGATKVSMITDVSMSGPIAQYGRGIIQDVSSHMVAQFAECIATRLTEQEPHVPSGVAAEVPQRPIGGFRVVLLALARAIGRGLATVRSIWKSQD
jgi:carbon monoxide dehydrogenase subunit G